MARLDLSGKRFGRWLVLYRDGRSDKKGHRFWICRCDCGTERSVRGCKLVCGEALACGCYSAENTSNRNRVHGDRTVARTASEYHTWTAMKRRVLNPRVDGYENYGGRGIKICDRWLNSYENFLKDMGRKPTPKHTIERKDVNGDYEPPNCIWATMVEQNNNQRNNRLLTLNGKTMTATQWSREVGINPKTVLLRLFYKWTPERALMTPVQKRERNSRGKTSL